ncbi:MAG: ribokinase [Fimbriimonas sp.]|nr:ribokinase [Fimbriimonas sp.]
MDHAEVMLVGSANVDLVVRAPRFPMPGETVPGSTFQTFTGGKGANQSVAVAKLGGKCGLVGKVGTDGFGDQLIASLRESGVDCKCVLREDAHATGVAMITLDDSGQNTIVVAPGTNALVSAEEVTTALGNVEFPVLLAQLEVPLDAVMAAANFASGRTFILNPAPARQVPDELLSKIDYLTPNETETRILTGILPTDDGTCIQAAQVLLDRGVRNVVITLGASGCFLANRMGGRHFPSIPVTVVDTTAAGDAFNGALARFLAKGESIDRAIHLANVTGALCVTKMGAQASMPSLAEVLARA